MYIVSMRKQRVDPDTFLTNRVLLFTVSLWIKTTSEAYARRELVKTGITDRGVNKIIKAAKEELATAPLVTTN
jgi:hypothetical protein